MWELQSQTTETIRRELRGIPAITNAGIAKSGGTSMRSELGVMPAITKAGIAKPYDKKYSKRIRRHICANSCLSEKLLYFSCQK